VPLRIGTDVRFTWEVRQNVVIGLLKLACWGGMHSLKEGGVILLSIQLSIGPDIVRHREG
jgi:hypothetical protein